MSLSFTGQYTHCVLPLMPLPPEYLVDCEGTHEHIIEYTVVLLGLYNIIGTTVRSAGFHARSISLGMLENQPP